MPHALQQVIKTFNAPPRDLPMPGLEVDISIRLSSRMYLHLDPTSGVWLNQHYVGQCVNPEELYDAALTQVLAQPSMKALADRLKAETPKTATPMQNDPSRGLDYDPTACVECGEPCMEPDSFDWNRRGQRVHYTCANVDKRGAQ